MRRVTEKLMDRPKLKAHDVSDLPKFSVEVDKTAVILNSMRYPGELDNFASLSKLVAKLQPSDVERCGEYGRRFERNGTPISFGVFNDFL